jgi:hypothetical protein
MEDLLRAKALFEMAVAAARSRRTLLPPAMITPTSTMTPFLCWGLTETPAFRHLYALWTVEEHDTLDYL